MGAQTKRIIYRNGRGWAAFAWLSLIVPGLLNAKEPKDIGPEPTWEQYQTIAERYLEQNLLDYPSARFQWQGQIARREQGYWTCVGVNSKNIYGAYTGWQWMSIWINTNTGKIRDEVRPDPWDPAACRAYLAR